MSPNKFNEFKLLFNKISELKFDNINMHVGAYPVLSW